MRALASAAGLAGLCLLVAARPALARDPADPADTRQVAARYVLHCGGCHGVDGRGTPGATPTLHGLAALADTEDGHRYLMRVPGVAQAPLADADLAELLDWLVATFSDEPVRRRFTAEEVGRWRAEPLRDPLAARAALGAAGAAATDGAGPAWSHAAADEAH